VFLDRFDSLTAGVLVRRPKASQNAPQAEESKQLRPSPNSLLSPNAEMSYTFADGFETRTRLRSAVTGVIVLFRSRTAPRNANRRV